MAREPKYRLVEKTVHEMIENGTLKVEVRSLPRRSSASGLASLA